MSIVNEKPAADLSRKPLWIRALMVAGGAAVALLALASYPPAFEAARAILTQPISNAVASDNGRFMSPADMRKHGLSSAQTVVHGMFVKDAYGCAYMFQYLSARLSLTPVLDEQQRPVCRR